MEVKDVDITELKPYERNAKAHPDKQVDQIAKSIDRFGWAQPLAIDENGVIIIGHGRYEAAKKLKLKAVPCVQINDLTDEEVRMLRLADNKLNESEWLDDILAEKLEDLDFGDLDIDFDIDIDTNPDEAEEDNFDEEISADEPRSKRGEIYQLGRHRLMCGDSTNPDDVDRLMGGRIADICVTSPPYGMSRAAHLRKHLVKGKDARDGKTFYGNNEDSSDTWPDLMRGFFKCAQNVTKSQFINVEMVADNKKSLMQFVNDNLDSLVDIMVWNKHTVPPQAQRNVLNNGYEFVFIFDNDNGSRTIRFGDFKGTKSNYIETQREQNQYSDVHKAVYSVEFVNKILDINSLAESVYDPFGGTGTTMIACEQLNKDCYMMELEPKYVDLTIDRWEQLTGKKAVKLNGENRAA